MSKHASYQVCHEIITSISMTGYTTLLIINEIILVQEGVA